MNHVQPIEQVLTELALRDHLTEVAIGRRDRPHVDATAGSVRSDLLNLTGFEKSEQQPLHPERHLANFIEKYRALVRDLELARLVAVRPREAAAHVPEQLRLEERLGQPGAVDRDEGSSEAAA